MISYEERGVSPEKKDVKVAIESIHKGLFPNAFCKAIPDVLYNSQDHCFLLHADGAGTKSSLAYIYYKEKNDVSIFKSIAQDSLVMNLDDLLCVGALGPFVLSNTIGRNLNLINGEIIKAVIEGYEEFSMKLRDMGIEIYTCGGETADLGDLVRTIIVDSVLAVRVKISEFINSDDVKPNQVIVGLASYGQAIYENCYNSGIGTNGFTSARHELLSSKYKEYYPESYAPDIFQFAYTGRFNLDDKLEGTDFSIGSALLSPTRTYAPVLAQILPKYRSSISAIFHNTGGGQTKCLNFGHNIKYIKDNLFDLPPIFKILTKNTNISMREAYRVFNMGHRLEIVCEQEAAEKIIEISNLFKVQAKVIGRTEFHDGNNCLEIEYGNKKYKY